MTTLSTHDTKRSDDVRARLAVLTEVPDEFNALAERWSARNARHTSQGVVDRGTEWFLYQTLVGAWPITSERLHQYMEKAMREAKIRTSWVANNAEYETGVGRFIDALLSDADFVTQVAAFVAKITPAGRINSLAQTLMKCTAPGVPDLYQGGELWDLSLVDPDNRRPVDYDCRRKLLAEVEHMDAQQVMERMEDGLPKLWVIHHALRLRNEHPEWFGREADYTPLPADGPQANRVLAYLRGDDVLTLAPRWSYAPASWEATTIELPAGRWLNRLTGRRYAGQKQELTNLLAAFPVALLVRDQAS
jgi:(1->4)-alpha-D-glucan 1-alpha-D-glucosylmutase